MSIIGGEGFVCVGIIEGLLSFGLKISFSEVNLCGGSCLILVVCVVAIVLLDSTLLEAVLSIFIDIFRLILLILFIFMSD